MPEQPERDGALGDSPSGTGRGGQVPADMLLHASARPPGLCLRLYLLNKYLALILKAKNCCSSDKYSPVI